MNHATDDEILELALLRGEPDAPENPHVKGCPSCAARFEAVLGERDLIRRALPPTDASPRQQAVVARTSRWSRASLAAALLLGGLIGAAVFRTTSSSRPPASSRAIVQVETALRRIPGEIQSLRDAEPSRVEAEYPGLLTKAQALYGDLLVLALSEPAPLTDEQSAELRIAVDALSTRIWTERDPERLADEFRDSLQAALRPEQFEVFQSRFLVDLQNGREEEIDILSDVLAGALNLRFSEGEKVREALRSRYPRTELPRLSLAQWPPDQLAQDAELVGAVRDALPPEYRAAFDRYLEALRSERERVERVARAMAEGEGR